jgi:hypothetical protein
MGITITLKATCSQEEMDELEVVIQTKRRG